MTFSITPLKNAMAKAGLVLSEGEGLLVHEFQIARDWLHSIGLGHLGDEFHMFATEIEKPINAGIADAIGYVKKEVKAFKAEVTTPAPAPETPVVATPVPVAESPVAETPAAAPTPEPEPETPVAEAPAPIAETPVPVQEPVVEAPAPAPVAEEQVTETPAAPTSATAPEATIETPAAAPETKE